MTQLFTILFVFSHFMAGLPTPTDIQNLPKAELVKMYSAACLGFFKQSNAQNFDLSQMMQTIVQVPASQGTDLGWLEGNGRSVDVIRFSEKICKSDPDLTALDGWNVELKKAADEYQTIVSQLPEIGDLHKLSLPQSTDLISSDNRVIADISIKGGRRKFISIDQLPDYLPKTFVAVEDGRFFEHKGVDEIGILRALMKDMNKSGARQGASTITQQLARNLFLSPEQTMRRKMQEILIAEKIEKQLSKKEILEIYMNLIYFGRDSWGIEKASQSYFRKNAKKLTLVEAAFLVGIVHGPNLYRNHPEQIENRVRFVLEKMKEQSILPPSSDPNLLMPGLKIAPDLDPYNGGYLRDYTVEQVQRTHPNWLASGVQIKTSIDSRMQIATNEALQEGLINYESSFAHRSWGGPLSNIQDQIGLNSIKIDEREKLRKLEQEKKSESLFSDLADESTKEDAKAVSEKSWVMPLSESLVKYPIPIARWRLAVLLDPNTRKIGLSDGRESVLSTESLTWATNLEYGDIFHVRPFGKNSWEVVQPPRINGAAVVMDTSGRVLALTGGFSYLLSVWNRATQAVRQPGSLMKPFTYLAALNKGIQPNTVLSDKPIYFPPLSQGGRPWTPENYEGEVSGPRPMRWALENSINILTAHLMTLFGLDPIRELTKEFGLYETPIREYPFILGAQGTTLLSLVKAYGEIANNGYVLSPQIIDEVVEPNNHILSLKKLPDTKIQGVDDISLFQIRYLLQGVIERGTAARLSRFAKVLAGKTGTTNDSKDVWFMGFTSNIVIGVYIGYDNPESLGDHSTGAVVALPIFEKIFAESIKNSYLPEAFPPPPRGIVFYPTNRLTGEIVNSMSKDTVQEAYREGSIKKE